MTGFEAIVELPDFDRQSYLKITTNEHGTTAYVREDVVLYLMDQVVINRYSLAMKFDPENFDSEIFNELWKTLGDELNELVEDTK